MQDENFLTSDVFNFHKVMSGDLDDLGRTLDRFATGKQDTPRSQHRITELEPTAENLKRAESELKEASPDEKEELLKWINNTRRTLGAKDYEEEILELLKENNVFRLYDRRKEVGFAVKSANLGGEKDLYIARMSVYPEGVGYGTKLMEKLIEYGRKHDFDTVMFIAEKPASVRIGEKLGFLTVGKSGISPIMKKILKETSEGNPNSEKEKEPWAMTKDEIRKWDFPIPKGGASKTPKTVFSWEKEDYETLYDLSKQKDQFRFNEVLGKGWEHEWKSMLHLKPKIIKNQPITIYRATEYDYIIPGSYVSESLEYAKGHLETILRGKGKILSAEVNPSELMIYGDPHEFIYIPESVESFHKLLIQKSLKDGKPVPEEVLEDYPELTRPKDLEDIKRAERRWLEVLEKQPASYEAREGLKRVREERARIEKELKPKEEHKEKVMEEKPNKGEIEAIKLKDFANVFLKTGIDEVAIDIRKDGWYAIAVNPKNTRSAEVLLSKEAWKDYNIREEITIGLDLERLYKYASDFKKGEVVDIEFVKKEKKQIDDIVQNLQNYFAEYLSLVLEFEQEIELPRLGYLKSFKPEEEVSIRFLKDIHIAYPYIELKRIPTDDREIRKYEVLVKEIPTYISEMVSTFRMDGALTRTFKLLDPKDIRRRPKKPELEYETKIALRESQVGMLKKVCGRKQEDEVIAIGVTELRGEAVLCALFTEKNRRDCIPLEDVSIWGLKATAGNYAQDYIADILSLLKKDVVATGTVTLEFGYAYPLYVRYNNYKGMNVAILIAPRIDKEEEERETEQELLMRLRGVVVEPEVEEKEPEIEKVEKVLYLKPMAKKVLKPFKRKEYLFGEFLEMLHDEIESDNWENVLDILQLEAIWKEEYYTKTVYYLEPVKTVELAREPANKDAILTILKYYEAIEYPYGDEVIEYYQNPKKLIKVAMEKGIKVEEKDLAEITAPPIAVPFKFEELKRSLDVVTGDVTELKKTVRIFEDKFVTKDNLKHELAGMESRMTENITEKVTESVTEKVSEKVGEITTRRIREELRRLREEYAKLPPEMVPLEEIAEEEVEEAIRAYHRELRMVETWTRSVAELKNYLYKYKAAPPFDMTEDERLRMVEKIVDTLDEIILENEEGISNLETINKEIEEFTLPSYLKQHLSEKLNNATLARYAVLI